METRKIYAILLSLIIPLFAYGNEVNNPSMEGAFISQPPLGDVAEYWTGWTETGGPSPGAFSEENSYTHEGSKSQEIRWDGWGWEDFGDDGIYQQISSLQPGQTYRVSAWFKFHFSAMMAFVGWASGNITCSVGTDPNGGTDPDVATNWVSASDSTYEDYYQGPWLNVVTFFSTNSSTATLFVKLNGSGDATEEDPFCPEPPCIWEAYWDAFCYIDDVNVQPIQIDPNDSTFTATTPVPINGASCSKVTITVVDSNGNPIKDIPPWGVVVDCTGSGNIITQPTQSTDENGRTTAQIRSTVSETKTVSATVLGTVLSDTPNIYFCESRPLKLRASDGADYDLFGRSVAIDGNIALVGATGDDDNGSSSGSAYIFRYNGSSWIQEAKLLASDGTAYDWFGRSVAINGNIALVGANGDDDNGSRSGSAYIFRFNGSNWVQEGAKLLASDGAGLDYFGGSVAIDGNIALVGASEDDNENGSRSGSAYIFRFNGSNWTQEAKLLASDGAADDLFGLSVAIDGNIALVGAPRGDGNVVDSGSAYVFRFDGSNWVQEAKLLVSDGAAYDSFGWSVAIDCNTTLIGGGESAYIFSPNSIDPNNWDQQAKLTASDATAGFGWSVSISGHYAIVGAYRDDDNGSESGSAYIFRRDGVNWIEQAKLTSPDAAAGDKFGYSVSVSGDYGIVGEYYGDSAYVFALLAADIDGDGDVDFADFSILAGQWMEVPGQPCADIVPWVGDCIVDFWDLKVFCDHWLGSTTPWVPWVATSKWAYEPGEAIVVNFYNALGDPQDWIGLYEEGAAHDAYIDWLYTDGTWLGTAGIIHGSVTFSSGLPNPGNYEARLFFNNSYNMEARTYFDVE